MRYRRPTRDRSETDPAPVGDPGAVLISSDRATRAPDSPATRRPATRPTGSDTRSPSLSEAGYRRGGSRTSVVEMLAEQDCAITPLELDDRLERRRTGLRLQSDRAARRSRPDPEDRSRRRLGRLRKGRPEGSPPSPSGLQRMRESHSFRGRRPRIGHPLDPRPGTTSGSKATTSPSAEPVATAASSTAAPPPRDQPVRSADRQCRKKAGRFRYLSRFSGFEMVSVSSVNHRGDVRE